MSASKPPGPMLDWRGADDVFLSAADGRGWLAFDVLLDGADVIGGRGDAVLPAFPLDDEDEGVEGPDSFAGEYEDDEGCGVEAAGWLDVELFIELDGWLFDEPDDECEV